MRNEPEIAADLDYAVQRALGVSTASELVEVLASARARGEAVRLLGSGTGQRWLPPPQRAPVIALSLAGLKGIERVEADDLTCTVRPGTTRSELDAALDERGVWLPCRGGTTLGGMFAAGWHAPAAPMAASPRSSLLGLEGVLADGTVFKCGARVVKSVAGFDLQKLFVGSRGRLWAATALHLKLRPRPRARLTFATAPQEPAPALAQFDELRLSAWPPVELWLVREANGGCSLQGELAGDPHQLERLCATHALRARAMNDPLHAELWAPGEARPCWACSGPVGAPRC
jgi:glycolate oxidase FAD binding subunit